MLRPWRGVQLADRWQTAAVHNAARVTQPKPKKSRKNRKLEQHRIPARWTFNHPNHIRESCSAVGQNHGCSLHAARITQPKPKTMRKNRKLQQHQNRASQLRSNDPTNIRQSCAALCSTGGQMADGCSPRRGKSDTAKAKKESKDQETGTLSHPC